MERRAFLRVLAGFTAFATGAARAVDFAEVRGQEAVKRAIVVATAVSVGNVPTAASAAA